MQSEALSSLIEKEWFDTEEDAQDAIGYAEKILGRIAPANAH